MWKSMVLLLVLGCRNESAVLVDAEVAEVGEGEGVFVDVQRPDVTTFALLSQIQVGDLVISEVMHTPTQSTYDSYGEWIELYNASAVAIDLQGLVISSTSTGDTSVTFSNSLVVGSGEYVLLATKSTGNGGLTDVDGYYSFVSVRHQQTDNLTIKYGSTTLDTVSWSSGNPSVAVGASVSLDGDDLSTSVNDSALHWYAGFSSYGDGDLGTPGTANAPLYMGNELSSGELVITEIMMDPVLTADWKGEWFEVYNPTEAVVQLSGLSVSSSNNTGFSVTSNYPVYPTRYTVFGNRLTSADNGGYTPNVYFANTTLSFGAPDDLVLSSSLGVVDSVSYTDGASYAGRSMSLSPIAYDSDVNDAMRMWCVSASVYGVGDYGTPGTANADCANIDYDGDGITNENGDCDDENALIGGLDSVEVCDDVDNDCDGLVDEEDDSLVYGENDIWYLDQDGDGYGASSIWDVYSCGQPVGFDQYV